MRECLGDTDGKVSMVADNTASEGGLGTDRKNEHHHDCVNVHRHVAPGPAVGADALELEVHRKVLRLQLRK